MTGAGATVARNAAVLTALRLGNPALSMIVVLAISRVLGSEGLGRYTLALTWLGTITTLTALGLNGLVMREGGRDGAGLPKLLANAATLTAATAIVSVPLMIAFSRRIGYDATTAAVLAVASLAILPATLLVLCDAIFTARQRTLFIGVYTLADVLIRVGVATLLIRWGYGVLALVSTVVVAQVAALAVAAHCLALIGAPLRPAFDRDVQKRLVGAVPVFLALSIVATLNGRADVLMLSAIGSIRDVGLYGAAYRIFDLIRLLPQSLTLAVYPLVAQAALTDPAGVRAVGARTLRVLLMATLPVAVGGTIVGGRLLAFMFGEEFRAGGFALAVLLWSAIPYAIVRYHAYVIVGSNHERADLALSLGLAGITMALNVALIPRFGASGSAIAALVAVCCFGAGQYFYMRRHLPGHLTSVPRLGRLVAAAGLMGLFVWSRQSDPLVVLLFSAALVYGGALMLTGAVSTRDIRRLLRSSLLPGSAVATPAR